MGRKLTPRQFEVLTGQYSDKDTKLQHVKDGQNKAFLTRRQIIAISEERLEVLRLRKVRAGEWTEAESEQKLHQWLQDASAKIPGPEQQKKERRVSEIVIDALSKMDTPETLLEKEYYFDEGLG